MILATPVAQTRGWLAGTPHCRSWPTARGRVRSGAVERTDGNGFGPKPEIVSLLDALDLSWSSSGRDSWNIETAEGTLLLTLIDDEFLVGALTMHGMPEAASEDYCRLLLEANATCTGAYLGTLGQGRDRQLIATTRISAGNVEASFLGALIDQILRLRRAFVFQEDGGIRSSCSHSSVPSSTRRRRRRSAKTRRRQRSSACSQNSARSGHRPAASSCSRRPGAQDGRSRSRAAGR